MSEIKSQISPALHPDTVRGIEGFDDETAPFVANVVSAFQDAYVTIGKIVDATELWKRNPATTEEQRILIVGKEAAKQQERLLRKMDSAANILSATVTHTESLLAQPLEARALGTLNAEIRGHAKSLNRAERVKLISEAMDSDDETTLSSILGSPPFLSGLSAVEHAHHLHQYHAKKNPHLVRRLAVMRSALEKVERDGAKIMTAMQKAVGAPPNVVRSIDAANEAALASLRIEPAA